jgi:hypothetical protein
MNTQKPPYIPIFCFSTFGILMLATIGIYGVASGLDLGIGYFIGACFGYVLGIEQGWWLRGR